MKIKELQNIVHDRNLEEVRESIILVQEILLPTHPNTYHIVVFADDTVWLYIDELAFCEWEDFKEQIDNNIDIIKEVKEIAPFLN